MNNSFEQNNRVYSDDGASPNITATGHEPKIMEIKCKQVGLLSNEVYDKMHDISRRVYDIDGAAPTLHTCGGGNLEPKIAEPHTAAMRGRNPDNPSDRTAGLPTEQRLEIGGENANTLTTVAKDSLVVVPTQAERFFQQAIETIAEQEVADGDTIDAFNKRVNDSGISPTLTTRPEGFKTAILPIEERQIEVGKQIRVRKLTERECFRLQGVKDEDFDKVRANQSKSSCYHLAGDAITVQVLMAIFGKMFNLGYENLIEESIQQLCNHTKN